VHRDLKPSNILVEPNRDPKLIDFGIARLVDRGAAPAAGTTDAQPLLGSIPYMSPEQCAGGRAAIDERTDVYALGVVLYQLLAGRLPYDVDSRKIGEAVRIIETVSPPSLAEINPDVSAKVAEICRRCLAKDPAERYADAAVLADEVQRATADLVAAAPAPPDGWLRLGRDARLGRRAMLAAAAAAAVAVPCVTLAVRGRRTTRRLSGEIDVMPLIDVRRDTVSGRWRLVRDPNGELAVWGDEATPAKLKLPVEPPEFSRRSGKQGIAVLCWGQGHGFGFDVGAVNNTVTSFQDIDGLHIGQNDTSVRRAAWIVPGTRHTAVVQVRRDRIAGFFDGELISQHETDFQGLSYAPTWDIPGGGLGVGSWGSPSVFHRIAVRPPQAVTD